MTQDKLFGNASWITAKNETGTKVFHILRSAFLCGKVNKATLRVVGLGFFTCRMNGRLVTDRLYLPLSTDYEPRENCPKDEVLTGHRLYVPEFDVSSLLAEGENILTIHYGGGWYTFEEGCYGAPKVIYRLQVETDEGTIEICSSENDRIGGSYVSGYYLTNLEEHDYSAFDDAAFVLDFDDGMWDHAVLAKPLDTEYLEDSLCPADIVAERIVPTAILEEEDTISYDCGRNLTGYPVLRLQAKKGERIEVCFSEERMEDGRPHPKYAHKQTFIIISDGTDRMVHPEFTWYAFRYFSVKGSAKVCEVCFVRADIALTSVFDSDNETLNWLYQASVNTLFCNMHTGIPSDCPHRERRGYTGDGQLTCHAVMNMMDAKRFYEKWIADIGDCQDRYSGHVQYTAPYLRSGGGPGGWGCAIVFVPYAYYRHYGETAPLFRLYGQMLRYCDYLEAHSRNGLVISDKKGEWCLGDWCPPVPVILPAPYINNYFYIKSLQKMKEIAAIVGRECDIPLFDSRIAERKQALLDAYFDEKSGDFIGGVQGANAFAADIGIGNRKTYEQLVKRYRTMGRFDTGIFGTDVVTRVLFEHGDGEVAVSLLTSTDPISFESMRRAGATTLWEYWPQAFHERSRNHPMFGAVTAYLFDALLGIRQEAGSAGYERLVIAPVIVRSLNRASGKRMLPKGEVSVAYEKREDSILFTLSIPRGVRAAFRYDGVDTLLSEGRNVLEYRLT